MENGEKRWLVDTSKWNPSPNDFSLALYVLPRERLALSPGFVSRNSLCILKKIVMSFFLSFLFWSLGVIVSLFLSFYGRRKATELQRSNLLLFSVVKRVNSLINAEPGRNTSGF